MLFLSASAICRNPGLLALVLLALLLPARAQAIDAPDGKRVADIFLDEVKVGRQLLSFRHEGRSLIVDDEIDISVPRLRVLAEHYLLRCHEVWRNGALAEIVTDVNDYGRLAEVDLTETAKGPMIDGAAGQQPAPQGLVPSSLWSIEMSKGQPVLDLDSGRVVNPRFSTGPEEPIAVAGDDVPARHVTAAGGLSRELWYGRDGLLVRQQYRDSKGQLLDFHMRPSAK